MTNGTRVQITRTSNKYSLHHVGQCGTVVGTAPLGMVVVLLDDGEEYWAETYNLKNEGA